MPGAVGKLHLSSSGINGDCACAEGEDDFVFGVKFRRAERQPVGGRSAGEIIVRQIRPVMGRSFSALSIVTGPA
jgi:hypothetical protein